MHSPLSHFKCVGRTTDSTRNPDTALAAGKPCQEYSVTISAKRTDRETACPRQHAVLESSGTTNDKRGLLAPTTVMLLSSTHLNTANFDLQTWRQHPIGSVGVAQERLD
jgi:hypothetical protein